MRCRPAAPREEPARSAHRALRRRVVRPDGPDVGRPRGEWPMTRRVKGLVCLLVVALLTAGCSFDVYRPPLPGGPDVGQNPITVTARFRDVLDLVPDSTVKVDDVTVGKITDISLEGYHAVVTMQLRHDTRLPDNAVATIQQTSLLGEKFIELAPPASGASSNPLQSGDV